MDQKSKPITSPEPGGFALLPVGLLKLWPRLPDHFRRTLPLLMSFMSTDTGTCYPSQSTLAVLAGVKRNAIWTTIDQMVWVGLLIKTHRGDPKRRNANTSCLYSLADLRTDSTRAAVATKLSELPSYRKALKRASEEQAVSSRTIQPVSCSALEDTANPSSCSALDDTGAVAPCTIQGLYPLGRYTNVLENGVSNEEEGASAPGGLSPAIPVVSDVKIEAGGTKDDTDHQFITALEDAIESEQLSNPSEEWIVDDEPFDPAEWAPTDIPANDRMPDHAESKPAAGLTPESPPPKAAIEAARATPARTAKAPETKSKALKGGKERTPEDVAQITASHQSMTRYLLHGIEGVYEPLKLLPPGNMNWTPFVKGDRDPGVADWDVPHFMGYFWWRVSYYRNEGNIPQTLPAWGRLAGDIKNLLKQMTKQQLFDYICVVADHFDLIKWMIGKAGHCMTLDSHTLSNSLVASTADSIAQMTDFVFARTKDKFQRSTGRFTEGAFS